jgi:GNAT superfamily N-acetyltransferase
MSLKHLLDNIMWHSLTGAHAKYSIGTDNARRYAPGFSPIVAFPIAECPDFKALAPYCKPDERLYCDGWSGAIPKGWCVDAESTMFKMVWESARPIDEAPGAVALSPAHASMALELARLTRPGPFGPRTIELGDYFGYFEEDRLVAMAGERTFAGGLREISGVCTHPDFQGRRLARRLMTKLMCRQMQRGETPFLHVMSDNHIAHEFYQRMGFRDYKESVVRVVTRC